MIDIHCHILPEIDDGPSSLEESLVMAREAVKEGITKIIATPHHLHPSYNNKAAVVKEKVRKLNEAIQKENIPLEILPGQEVRISGDVMDGLVSGDILTLADQGKYLFVEFSSNHVSRYADKLFFQLLSQDIIPIIVHPERNHEFLKNPGLLYDLVNGGALTQITTSSLTGHLGKKIKKFTEQIIEADLTHFLASDAHNVTERTFRIREAFALVEKNYGSSKAYEFQENAELLVENQHVMGPPPQPIVKKKLVGIF